MNILISVLSDYLQPNFLLIREFSERYDKLVFVTTNYTEEKSKALHLCNALGIKPCDVEMLSLGKEEDNYDGISEILRKRNFPNSNHYILNLTGGTKIITLSVYDHFARGNYDSEFYYVPDRKSIIKSISPTREPDSIIKYRMCLREYFCLLGLKFVGDNNLFKTELATNNLYAKYKSKHYNKYWVPELRDCQQLTTPDKKRYFGGEWFEEYCFSRLKRELAIPDDCIIKSAKIFRNSPDEQNNEADVMFVKDNQLYLFECKVVKTDWTSSHIEPYLYKLSAITKNYGLRVNTYLLTLCDMYPNVKKHEMLMEKINILGIKKVFGFQDFEKSNLDL